MVKKFVLMLFWMTILSGCASTVQDVGGGLMVGGAGSGRAEMYVAGYIMEQVGQAIQKPNLTEKQTTLPESQPAMQQLSVYKFYALQSLHSQFMAKITTKQMKEPEIIEQAKSFCAEIDKKIEAGEAIALIPRSSLESQGITVAPEHGEFFPYRSNNHPLGDCVLALVTEVDNT